MDGKEDLKVLAKNLYEDAVAYLQEIKIYDDIDPADQNMEDWNQNLLLYYYEAKDRNSVCPVADAVHRFAGDIIKYMEERGQILRYEENRTPPEELTMSAM